MDALKQELFSTWLASNSGRFSVELDGRVWFERLSEPPVLHLDVDATPFLEEMAKTGPGVNVMVDHLLPREYNGVWRLGMQTQSANRGGHAVFTPYKQELPRL